MNIEEVGVTQGEIDKARDAFAEWLTLHENRERSAREMFYWGYLYSLPRTTETEGK